MNSPKQAAVRCAEECVKLANQRFHMRQEIERLKESNSIFSEELSTTEAALKLSASKYNMEAGVKAFVDVNIMKCLSTSV